MYTLGVNKIIYSIRLIIAIIYNKIKKSSIY